MILIVVFFLLPTLCLLKYNLMKTKYCFLSFFFKSF